MSRMGAYATIFCIGIWVGSLIIAGCSEDKAMTPSPVQPEDFVVYFYDGSIENWYYSYHPTSNQVDSFYLPYSAWHSFAVSNDGQTLYIGQHSSVAVIDLATLTIVHELPYSGAVIPSPDGRFIAILGNEGHFFNTTDYSLVYTLEPWARSGTFTPDGNHFYYTRVTPVPGQVLVRELDIANGFATLDEYSPKGAIIKCEPSPDESRLYGYFYTGDCSNAFGVYDIALDSIIFWHEIIPGQGDMVVSPDGRYVYYSSPGFAIQNDFCPCPDPLPVFYRYDAVANQSSQISTNGLIEGIEPGHICVDGLEITPDGRWLTANQFLGSGIVLTFDLSNQAFVHGVNIGGASGRQILGLTCQKSQ